MVDAKAVSEAIRRCTDHSALHVDGEDCDGTPGALQTSRTAGKHFLEFLDLSPAGMDEFWARLPELYPDAFEEGLDEETRRTRMELLAGHAFWAGMAAALSTPTTSPKEST